METTIRKRDWILILGSVILMWVLDFATKQWALTAIKSVKFWGPFGLVLHRNPGAMLGMFSELPPILRIVSLSTGGAFLVFVYGSLQYLLPMRSMTLRIGMSFLLGGILGNVTDRIIWGSVVDFLVIRGFGYTSPAFNYADAIQWVGYFMVVVALIRDGKHLWPSENSRKKIWVNPSFQIKYCLKLSGIGVAFSIISGVFSYTFLKVVIDDLVVGSLLLTERKFIHPFLFTYAIISLGFAIILFLLGRILSHRTAGPLYAFEKFLDDVLAGKNRPLKLRAGDEFKHLQEVAEQIRVKLFAAETHDETPPTTDSAQTDQYDSDNNA